MDIRPTRLAGVLVVTPRRFGDDRGFFSETWNAERFREAGIDAAFVQDNHSRSARAGTVRGLHFQAPPHAQDKLVRVIRGSILDVAVDARRGSPTYGGWVAEELSAESGAQMLIPKGFLHGFVTREAGTEVLYKCSDYYVPEAEGAVRFDDPDLGIDWGIESGAAVLSDKDAAAPSWAGFDSPFTWEGEG